MEIRNNLLAELKKKYLNDLLNYYDEKEAEQLLTILIEHFFEISRNELIINSNHRLSESEILKLHKAYKELKQYKPVQYITGVVEFHGLKIKVNSAVLIPRPETEELVQLVTDLETSMDLIVLDTGTGSGCIAIGLSSLLKRANIHASDICENVINIARKNAELNNQHILFHIHDILNNEEPLLDRNGEKVMFDIVISNPPYVTLEDKKKMHPNVIDYEPSSALFVTDENPLEYYLSILQFCEKNLVLGGRLYFEINEGMGDEVVSLLKRCNYSDIVLRRDINGKFRFVSSKKGNT
ncbi:MAG: protein-(glutamine-N5) methyltransferase, release factor-specific [Bacteroidetes bacterium]|nr:protein-(glutamine-N5) methyltransferase, release factor-specific [Bacteroidota bacterium]